MPPGQPGTVRHENAIDGPRRLLALRRNAKYGL
ncbi:uncharacterized protein ANIA_11368 [Aspergillus nidulans FGSC A4]|uniref:Uncharacterized protein n=1 Tax=Emericella nidulans (strain FGSC A4 / ATCC 38163 / CBS 112.46 / NRRL 194 / M139) TaxID=227321 RepID=C8VJI0_EMENI|nr:hypothetical protein [Aspergillus nidulans FGSC A4]CBF83957.1 TPA: hypothetical protein ANIA_11368 [Aspergillus nidulans FGSC A4]